MYICIKREEKKKERNSLIKIGYFKISIDIAFNTLIGILFCIGSKKPDHRRMKA